MTIPTIIASAMEQYEQVKAQQLQTDVELINTITGQLSRQKGKQLRPILTLLSAGASMGHVPERKIPLAVAMELLHTSSLIHDDVVDESTMRRGIPTINSSYSNKIAVLYGDYCLANVIRLLNRHATPEEMDVVNQTTVEMTEGVMLQQQSNNRQDLSLETYLSTIHKKTASLISACCQIGQWSAEHSDTHLSLFGHHFGMAFQMRDDLLDYSPMAATGKPYGNDIREHKMTLPLILFLSKATEGDKAFTQELLRKEVIDDMEVMQLIAAMEKQGALEATREHIRHEVEQALAALTPLPASPYKEALVQVTNEISY